jgi:diacylglycerol kinase family enzyme
VNARADDLTFDHAPAERSLVAAPPRRPVLFVNPRSGDGRASRARIAERARERGVEVIELTRGQNLKTLVDEALAAGADALGVAGGDGSLGLVAAAASANQLPLVCIPAGTRNHFTRDLGLDPDDPAAALNAFSDRVESRIDVGEVNGRPFLNVVSLGIYGEAVRRSAYRDAKLSTLLETARTVLGPGGQIPELALVDDVGGEHSHAAIVLVSNNPYALGRRAPRGARPTLAGGRLGIIVVDAPAAGRPPSGRAWSATHLEVDAPETVHAGLDGEAVELSPPLKFAIRPRALRIWMPRRESGRQRLPRPVRGPLQRRPR